jgi:hypothetical protein
LDFSLKRPKTAKKAKKKKVLTHPMKNLAF